MSEERQNAILRIHNLTKEFPGVKAVSEANLEIFGGEIHSIVGGNGAGKSTLMKMLAGVYAHNTFTGTIELAGETCEFKTILDAQSKGIVMIPQDLNMLEELSVAENLFMNKYPMRRGFIDYHKMYEESQKIIEDFGLDVEPQTKVKEIGIAQKQLLVIARAMYNDVKVLLLDEPTATLSDKECKILFAKTKELKRRGIACIYISHRLEEVKEISDIITVMRDGHIVGTAPNVDMDEKRIVSLMVGRKVDEVYPAHDRTPGEVILSVKNVTIMDQKVPDKKIVDHVSFDLRRGEILSMYGLVGAGRSETALAIIGGFNGEVTCEQELKGKPIYVTSPGKANRYKIGYLPEDRKKQGVVDIASVGRNITMSSLEYLSKLGFLDKDKERDVIADVIKRLAIKTPSPETLVRNMSGGNAQKCVLGRWIAAESEILILDEATQGIDVEAKTQIYYIMDELAKKGKSILFISSDLSEVMGISDRILTMRHGKVVNITDGKSADKNQILWEATVGSKDRDEEALDG